MVAVFSDSGEDVRCNVADVDFGGSLAGSGAGRKQGVVGRIGEDVKFGGLLGEAFCWRVVERVAGEGEGYEG